MARNLYYVVYSDDSAGASCYQVHAYNGDDAANCVLEHTGYWGQTFVFTQHPFRGHIKDTLYSKSS